MVQYIEFAGIILILVGVVYTFLKAMGKFSSKAGEEGEIESKMFTLKGGPGIILVGLGVFLLIISVVSEKPAQPSNLDGQQPGNVPIVFETPKKEQPSATLAPTSQPTFQQTTPKEATSRTITTEFIIGTWRYTASDGGITFMFLPNGAYESEVQSLYSAPIYSSGRYTISNSIFTYVNDVTGGTDHLSLTYIDKNSMMMDNLVFERVN